MVEQISCEVGQIGARVAAECSTQGKHQAGGRWVPEGHGLCHRAKDME